jgi:hypothetical protein
MRREYMVNGLYIIIDRLNAEFKAANHHCVVAIIHEDWPRQEFSLEKGRTHSLRLSEGEVTFSVLYDPYNTEGSFIVNMLSLVEDRLTINLSR